VILGCCAALAVAACSSDHKRAEEAVTSTVAPTTIPAPSTPKTLAPTTTTLELSTTSLPCQSIPTPKTPVTNPGAAGDVLLTRVHESGDRCVDHVVFDFTSTTTDPPGYRISYGAPPFSQSESGAPLRIAGGGFIVVRLAPANTVDFLTGKVTYTGPQRIPVANANHVRELVQGGNFEGVITWIIGLDGKRPFSVQATGTTKPQLVVTIS
jgi:hypothetical protein